MRKISVFILAFILAVSFVVRLYKIDNPIADWHSWRQADTAAVSRNFYKYGYTPFVPKYDDMSGVAENPIPNPGRYRFVEFPIYESAVYFAYLLNGGVKEELARLITVFISLGSLIYVYLLARKYFGEGVELLSALIFGILPYSIYYSRVILPDPLMVFPTGVTLFFRQLDLGKQKTPAGMGINFYGCGIFDQAVCRVLFFTTNLFLLQKRRKFWPIPKKYFLILLAFLPFLGWRLWINQHPEGIPASKWLFNGNGIRLRPAWWEWIVGDRLGKEILGAAGTFLFILGMLKRPFGREGWFLHLLSLSSLLYLVVVATGNVQHDYYQTLIIPAVSIFVARGAYVLFKGVEGFAPRLWTIPLAAIFLALTIYLPWLDVKGLYQVNNNSIVKAGVTADKILPKDAVVVAPYQGDTSFLYQTNRYGWPFIPFPIPEMIKKYGVTAFVSVAEDAQTKWVERNYTVLEKNPEFVIVDLTKPNPTADPFDKEP